MTEIHATHIDIIKRLKRANGHLASVISMLEEERSCIDVAQQLQAVEIAITNAKKALIHDHIDHCLEYRVKEKNSDKIIKEFKEISKYL
jgi:DNA-binding FrmR family transcriptional regulator